MTAPALGVVTPGLAWGPASSSGAAKKSGIPDQVRDDGAHAASALIR